jgi:aminomethyltransferase
MSEVVGANGDAIPLLRSPVHERHVALGAKFGEFGGWSMPLEYAGGGVLAEHAAVRNGVGIFDVSHLGKASVRGTGAAAFVNATLTNDLDRITAGQAQYSLCVDDATGGVVDDLIVYLRSPADLFLVPNAANTADVVHRLADAAPDGVAVQNLHRDFAVIAVQGPQSPAVLDAAGLASAHDYMSFVDVEWTTSAGAATPVTVCRSGYTGERGYELIVASEHALELWDHVSAVGVAFDLRPCGLGARDTLRTEMGYPLHGHELSLEITPNQARVGWAVGWSKPSFWGREPLLAERSAGPRRVLRGLLALDRGIPRPAMSVTSVAGDPVGEITSGTFSPTLRVGIALALLHPDVVVGDEVRIDVRGRSTAMRVVAPPFIEASVR